MRTIKFRAKNLDGEWVYGFYVEEERQTLNGFEKKHFIVNDGYDYVKPDTVGQFTGLYDKDGKEIYEGDTVVVSSYRHERKYEVKWYGGGFHYGEMYPLSYPCGNVKVVGNIHNEVLKQ